MDSLTGAGGQPRPIDLDSAATTPLDDGVWEVMQAAMIGPQGNPSSRHSAGVSARRGLEQARATVARTLDARLESVLFTSGGTEANNLAVLGLAHAQQRHGRHVLVGSAEHPSVSAPAAALAREGFEVEEIPLEADGTVNLPGFETLLRDDTVLVAQMLVNNLLGSIAPVRHMARLARSRSPHVRMHVDAVQAVGKVELSFENLGVDTLALSAHKLHGPRGSGALLLAEKTRIEPLLFGGGQEGGLRPGTENCPAHVGLAEAVRLATEKRVESESHLTEVRAILLKAVSSIRGARVFETRAEEQRVSSILAVGLPGPAAEVWMHHLEQAGVLTSVGSACQARTKALPPAFAALGLTPEEARHVLRLSVARTLSIDDAHRAGQRIAATADRLRSLDLLQQPSTGSHA